MRRPTVEDIIAGDGWAGLDNIGTRLAAAGAPASEQSRIVELADRVLSSDAGRALLEHLVEITLKRPMLPATVIGQQPVTSEQCVPYVAFREGQNAIVEHLLALLRAAHRARQGGQR